MLRTDDLDYSLPDDLIATRPAEPRDSARLLVVSRADPARLEHRAIRDLPEVLRPADRRGQMPPDLMIVNATRVLPARFRGMRVDTKGHVEGLYVQPAPAAHPSASAGPLWIVLLKMRRMKPGVVVSLFDRHDRDSGITLRLVERADDTGSWIVLVESRTPTLALTPGMTAADLLEWIGLTPIPPYILAARRKAAGGEILVADDADRKHYQTVYATDRGERPGYGSVAAPTAGLHFTPALLDRLRDVGVRRAEVTLDVGLGTFKPVETEHLEQHKMHTEWCRVPPETAEAISRVHPAAAAPAPRGRVIAVGTTAARTLESFDAVDDMFRSGSKLTNLLISPGHHFRHVDALLTNFHLPRSTLMALVAAALSHPGEDPRAAVDRLKLIYAQAVREKYRFYSYGDAMLILP